jgi:hypothetical protein
VVFFWPWFDSSSELFSTAFEAASQMSFQVMRRGNHFGAKADI